ncbi:MAG: DNA repair protein RecO [Thermodesulfovibrio sp.]|nr:DNA repair protein RecO [Thermodesulfovibrio sp.]
MLYTTEAIVLNNYPYGEADLIVVYFTKEYGVLNLFAKSPRKIKSRFGSSLEPLTYSKVAFIGREDRLQRIIQSDIIESFYKIRENFNLFKKIAEILRFIIQISPKKEANPKLFLTFTETLFQIKESNTPDKYLLYLKIAILKSLGYLPDFLYCGVCAKKLNGVFYYSEGFPLCKECLKKEGKEFRSFSKNIAQLITSFSNWDVRYLKRVHLPESLTQAVERFIDSHIQTILSYNKIKL